MKTVTLLAGAIVMALSAVGAVAADTPPTSSRSSTTPDKTLTWPRRIAT